MAVTRSSRAVSPTPSNNSDMYWEAVDAAPSPAPSETADPFGMRDNFTPTPMDSTNTTPTPQNHRAASLASAPAPTAAPKSRAKKNKGKKKADTETRDEEDPFLTVDLELTKAASMATRDVEDPTLVADIERTKATSLGITTSQDYTTQGALSSCRPIAEPGSPSKRLRANTVGDAAPAPFATDDTTTAPTTLPLAVIHGHYTHTPTASAPATINPGPATPVDAVPPLTVTAPATTSTAAMPPAPMDPAIPSTTHTAATHIATPIAGPAVAATTVPPNVAHTSMPVTTLPATTPTIGTPTAAPAAVTNAVPTQPATTYAGAVLTAMPNAIPAQPAAVAAHAVLAPAAAPPPLWITADGLPPYGSFTPTPPGGFPTIVYSPEQLLQGVPADLQRMYDAVPHPKFFMVVSGGNGAVMRTHGLIRESIGNFINIDPASFTLGTPPTADDGTSPSLWLTADITAPLAQHIVDNRIISSNSVTIFPLPYHMPIVSFISVFAGFTLPDTAAGANAARDLLRTAIANNSDICTFVQTHWDAFGPHVSAEQALTIFLDSINVQGIILLVNVNDTTTVAWRLRVTPPTDDRQAWAHLRRLFGKLQVMMALYGTAHLQPSVAAFAPASTTPLPFARSPTSPAGSAQHMPPSPRLRALAALPPRRLKTRCASTPPTQLHPTTGMSVGAQAQLALAVTPCLVLLLYPSQPTPKNRWLHTRIIPDTAPRTLLERGRVSGSRRIPLVSAHRLRDSTTKPAGAGATGGLAPAILNETPLAVAPLLLWPPWRQAKSDNLGHARRGAVRIMAMIRTTLDRRLRARICHPTRENPAKRWATKAQPEVERGGPQTAPVLHTTEQTPKHRVEPQTPDDNGHPGDAHKMKIMLPHSSTGKENGSR
ncbi:hypothetical protein DFH07DRAFT_962945 [Mycena maculata]|uniref:Uncharacterized protein n=1 Tax=Mycena maculata TaxID=230809 RepID=A0AAD7N5I7_9AGAR|nr:hypothetical protein DFH07DRAFT_962945 [Mycena maculata]